MAAHLKRKLRDTEELTPPFSVAPEPADSMRLANEASRADLLKADHDLAQRCVTGEVHAWEELHEQCNGSLLATIRVLLAGRSNDPNLADEIAAQVWYGLVENDGELLLRYDPSCGARLITFMRAIARDMMCRHFRSERRRLVRESTASSERPQHHATERDQFEISLDEFLETLSPAERQFCGAYLLSREQAGDASSANQMTQANLWQKTHRVYRQFVRFFGSDSRD